MSNILVTGGAGFIGSTLVDRLIVNGHHVVVIDNLSTGLAQNVPKHASFVLGDVVTANIKNILRDNEINYVFHLAAQVNLRRSIAQPQEDARINILGTINLLEQCAEHNIAKFIFSSTGGALYAEYAPMPCKESAYIKPKSPYGLSKHTAEHYLRMFSRQGGFDHVILRFSNVYGPRQNAKGEAGVISIFVDNILNGRPCTVFGNGKQTRDYIYVDDVAGACMMAMEEKMSGPFNVSSGIETSLNDLVIDLFETAGLPVNLQYDEPIAGELLRSCLSSELLATNGWRPETTLREGLKKTVDYYKKLR